MVDKDKRAEAAKVIDEFFSGSITNFEYENRFPKSDSDPALHAIYTALWFNYDDIREHRLSPEEFTVDSKTYLETIQLFLHSECEYAGPRNFIDLLGIPKRLWNWIIRRPKPEQPACWPFETDAQLENARMLRR